MKRRDKIKKYPFYGSLLLDRKEVIFVLEEAIKREYNVFEYGCGIATNFFSAYVNKWYSVEHDPTWAEKVKAASHHNTTIFTEELKDGKSARFAEDKSSGWDDVLNSEYAKRYDTYIKAFSYVKDIDLVIIDGRARTACAKYVYENMREDCKVIIHDWSRPWYKRCLESFEAVKELSPNEFGHTDPYIAILQRGKNGEK